MKKISKFAALLLAMILLVSSLAGCGGGKDKKPADSGKQPEATTTASDGALKLAITTGDGSSTDDKIPTPWYNRQMATNLMFRSLLKADSTLSKTEADLAEVTVSEDGMAYTVTLKDGLKWSDGEALTVDDVIFSIETAQKTAQINSIYTAAFANIAEMKADGNVLTISMKTPYAAMMNILSQFAILPKHSLEKADPLSLDSDPFWQNPVCSGMYCLDELKKGNYFTLKLNENYEGTAPKIKKITTYFVSDFVTAAQAGNVDYVFGNDAGLVEKLSNMENFTTNEVDVLFYKYFIFNMKGIDGKENEAMQNVEVRKALMKAIDRATLANLYPNATVLNSGVPNENEAYNGFEYKFDAEAAKKELAASGYDMSRKIKICYYNNDQTSIDLINMVVYYLEQMGLTVEATLSNDGTTDLFTTRDYDIGFKGKASFSIDEWYTEYMSTDALFANIFGGGTEFDSLIAELSAATDPAKRNEVLKQLQDLEQKNVYKVPAFTVGTYVFTSNNVKIPEGVTFCNPLYSCDLDFENWELAK
ncbi:MAG: ABC transporter substrate-binding protein [Lachnospiraceae bacterium]|nr:ABC transporter substrate-binding protein [Lachnospiraceae bacterium]